MREKAKILIVTVVLGAVLATPAQAAPKPDKWQPHKGVPAWIKHCSKARCVPSVVRYVFKSHAAYALRIVRCETGGTFSPYASGDGGTSYGIFQIHWTVHPWSYVHSPRELFNPYWNAKMAYRLSHGGVSWSPWTCARYV